MFGWLYRFCDLVQSAFSDGSHKSLTLTDMLRYALTDDPKVTSESLEKKKVGAVKE
jgi:hypothetical protein